MMQSLQLVELLGFIGTLILLLDHRGRKASLVYKDLQELTELLVLRDHRAHRGLLEQMEPQVHKDQLALLEQLVRKVQQALPDLRDQLVQILMQPQQQLGLFMEK
jgi:hypothetical protein